MTTAPFRERGWHHFDKITARSGLDPFSGMVGYKDFYVDSTNGSDSYNGRSWGRAKATIQAGVNLCTGRARHRVWVAPGGYSESVETPLNADAAFGQIIAYSPTTRSWGAAYWGSGGASEPCLTVRGRGWRLSGFEMDSPTGAAAVLLQRNIAGTLRSSGMEIDHCFIGATITGLYGVEFQGADSYIHIHDCDFSLLQAVGGAAIKVRTTPHALPLLAIIEDCDFRENESHILAGASWGFNGAVIRGNRFQGSYANGTTITKMIDIRGGRDNLIFDNDLGVSQAQYDNAAGPCLPGTGDQWVNNRVTEGVMDEVPGGG